jgi:nucleotide-binding universal stress UspA family protein
VSGQIVVGYVPGQPDAVLLHAAQVARRFDAELVCAIVDEGRYVVEELPDGSVRSMPIDPDVVDEEHGAVDPKVLAHVDRVLADREVRWSVRALAGEPATALAHLADALDAAMIVIGTRETHRRRSLHDFFAGSIAVRLAHRQHRPVLVVPLSPVSNDADLPWTRDR